MTHAKIRELEADTRLAVWRMRKEAQRSIAFTAVTLLLLLAALRSSPSAPSWLYLLVCIVGACYVAWEAWDVAQTERFLWRALRAAIEAREAGE